MTKKNKPGNGLILSMGLYLLVASASILFFSTSFAADNVVDEIEIKGLTSINEEELLYLLDIRPGITLDRERIRLGIKRAFLKGVFEDIAVEKIDEEKVKVIIHVRERNYIDNISVEGNFALSTRAIKNLFLLKEGELFVCDSLDKAKTNLIENLAMRGFPRATIDAKIVEQSQSNKSKILLSVNTGIPEKIKKISITGAGDEIKSVMKLDEGDIYDQIILKKDIETIKAHYKKRGYFNPIVGPAIFLDGNLTIPVNTGKQLKISIEGNKAISKKNLLTNMSFFEAEDFNDDLVAETVSRMLSMYYSSGYPFAQIAPVITSKDDLILLNLFIFEGQRIKTGEISFAGNSQPANILKEIMSLKEGSIYNANLMEQDREALKAFYNSLGYLSTDVEEFHTQYDENANMMNILVKVEEGVNTKIETIDITGVKHFSKEEVGKLIKIEPGDAYNEIDISDARFRIIDFYSSSGFPEVQVAVKRDFQDKKASLTFNVDEGTKLYFGKAIITGNHDTNYAVIKRELSQEEGMPFNYSLLTKQRQNLYKLGLFTDIDIEVLDSHDQKKDVLMKMHEGNAGAVELGIGYADYEKLRGFIDIGYRNLWGMNRQASVRLELSSLEKRFIIQYYEPWFLNTLLPFRALLLSEEKEEVNIDTGETRYRLTRETASAGFEKKISGHLKSELYYEFSHVNTYDLQPDVVLSKEDTGTIIISGLRPALVYDTRNNPFYPSKGILSGISLKLTSSLFFSETDFLKVNFYFNLYKALSKKIVFAVSFRGGIAQGYNETEELPIVERFFLGGRTTVRGYNQDTLGPKGPDGTPTGGNAFLMENLEMRVSVSKNLGFVAFLDGGNVWLDIEDIDVSDLKFTTGLGLRYNTPVGPVRIDYGYKLQREEDESSGEIHFSIGHAF
jgi:outer membrane protein insertion porin family